MVNELHDCVTFGRFERVKQLVEGGANIEETNEDGKTALLLACQEDQYKIVVYLVEHGANVAHTDSEGRTALHWACANGILRTVKCLLDHGASIAERDHEGMTALLYAVENRRLQVVKYMLSSEGGASITEADDKGNTALLLAAKKVCHPPLVQWLLEYGGAQLTDSDNEGTSVWSVRVYHSLPHMLKHTYEKGDDGEYVSINGEYVPDEYTVHNGDIVTLTAMLRVIVLHGDPPDSLTNDLAPPFQQIVQDGARLRARLPAYLAQRRALLDAHCPLLPPLRDLVHGYEEPTTDELWATGLGAPLQRTRGQSPERKKRH
jgi:hypothetical protein